MTLVANADVMVRHALLGVRFSDASTGLPVTDMLVAELHEATGERRVRPAVRGPSGVHSFHDIPGLRALEDVDLALTPPAGSKPFVLYVDDVARRYLPVTLSLDLPLAQADMGVPLMPSAAYPIPAEWAVVRLRVGDQSAVPAGETPDAAKHAARWARVDLAIASATVATSFGDDRGEVAVFFPYPTGTAVQWTVTLTARYRPASQQVVNGRDVPELKSILAQPAAAVVTAWPDGGAAVSQASIDFTLTSGAVAQVATGSRRDLWVVPTP